MLHSRACLCEYSVCTALRQGFRFPVLPAICVCRVLLLAFEDASQMAALHFIGAPPGLAAQLMPLQLPRLVEPSQSTSLNPAS